VNSSVVWLPRSLSVELSLVLGTIIANRLPTLQASLWRKALALWNEHGGISLIRKKSLRNVPDASWPMETVLFAYPGKRTYGRGELILWELKLLGESADHNLFLEIILPALEAAGSIVDEEWQSPNCLWGHFNIHSIYVARGHRWEPLVDNGKLDLRYQATPLQWSEGLLFDLDSRSRFNRLTWVTPFDLVNCEETPDEECPTKRIRPYDVPTLKGVLEALITRMSRIIPGRYTTPDDLWELLGMEDKMLFRETIEQVSDVSMLYKKIEPVSRLQPGRWIGKQKFTTIPAPVVPCLELASIFHVGGYTHFGCGTFVID